VSELTSSAGPVKPRLDLVGWILRVLVAMVFVYEGLDKFGTRRLWIRVFAEIGIGQWFRYATGIVEIVGAALLLIPRATTIAVTMLACTLVGAFLAHIFIIGIGVPHSVLVALLFAAVIAIRWRRRSALQRFALTSMTR
jgi:putative oxidoreductase